MSKWPHDLLRWFALHRREMPWRERATPYRVWISEVMLQQTRVETVVPYFLRFVDRYPDAAALARADQQEVLKSWEGLGYYARARNLHRAAGVIADEHGGRLPRTFAELRKLPGFGPYTAAAVASIAFRESVPVVDGNVLRVFTRFYGIENDTRLARTRTLVFRKLVPVIEALVSERTLPGHERAGGLGLVADSETNLAGDFNQAIMELGALVCRRKPICTMCPLRGPCVAEATGRTDELPFRSKRARSPHHEIAVGVIWREDRILIGRRRADQMLGGLWEFPGGKREGNEPLEETARREILEETGLDVRVMEPYATVEHAYTHLEITMTAFRCRPIEPASRPVEPEPRSADELRWVTLEELDAFPFPRASLKVIEAIRRLRDPAKS